MALSGAGAADKHHNRRSIVDRGNRFGDGGIGARRENRHALSI
jgi:hypothetical protein